MTKARTLGHIFSWCKILEGAASQLKHRMQTQRLAMPVAFILTAASWKDQGTAKHGNCAWTPAKTEVLWVPLNGAIEQGSPDSPCPKGCSLAALARGFPPGPASSQVNLWGFSSPILSPPSYAELSILTAIKILHPKEVPSVHISMDISSSHTLIPNTHTTKLQTRT